MPVSDSGSGVLAELGVGFMVGWSQDVSRNGLPNTPSPFRYAMTVAGGTVGSNKLAMFALGMYTLPLAGTLGLVSLACRGEALFRLYVKVVRSFPSTLNR